MTHRIVCLADTHLRSADPWNSDRLAAWDQAITEAASLDHLAAWVHAGDVFDGRSSVQDRNDVAERLQRMLAVAPVLIVQGNHEAPGDLAIFRRLAGLHPIVVAEAADVVDLPLATGGTASVFALAYPSKGALVAAGYGAVEAAQALDVLFMDAAQKLAAARARGHVTFMVGHANITGARSSTGQPMIGQEISVSATHLARIPGLKLFGHIHLPQELHDAVYVGSGSRLSWGETEAKRYLVATLQDDSTYTLASRQLACPPRYHVEGLLTRDGFEWRCTKGPGGEADHPPDVECSVCGSTGDGVRHPIEGTLPCVACGGRGFTTEWTGCDVRVRFRYHQAERELLGPARERIKTIFAGARHLELEPVATQTREARAPEVVAAQTLPEKLKAWARLTDTAWSGEIGRCAAQLLASEDGESVAADVDTRLASLAAQRQQEQEVSL
jgi:DNA repair exonuclease SbcCD nuclease subunit